MPDLANLDQALRDIWTKLVAETPWPCAAEDLPIEAMRIAYRLGMSAEGLARQFIKGGE